MYFIIEEAKEIVLDLKKKKNSLSIVNSFCFNIISI